MNSLLRPHGGGGVAFLQLWLELGWLVAAVVLAVRYHSALSSLSSLSVVASALVFALLMVGLNAAFGIYRRDRRLNFGEYAVRQSAALVVGLPAAYGLSHMLPGGTAFQQAFGSLVLIALGGLLAVRQIAVSAAARRFLPYRVLVLGTGPEALAVETSLDVEFSVDLIKQKKINWPRLENQDYIMVLGSSRAMNEALQHATTELMRWLMEGYGFDERAASLLLGQAMEYEISNVVDPEFTFVAKMRKQYVGSLR